MMAGAIVGMDQLTQDALRRGCCRYQGAAARWAALAEHGATDDQIVEQLNFEFGLGGGCSGPGWTPVWSKGNPPRVWFDRGENGKPHLGGQELIAQVRLLFGIHQPAPEGQLALFEGELRDDLRV